MSEIIAFGLDLTKNVFQVRGADGAGSAVQGKKPKRDQVLDFFGRLSSCIVVTETGSSAHFWSRDRQVGP